MAGSYTITVTGNFSATGGPPAIDNPNVAAASLVIKGDDYTVEGQDNAGVRPF